MSRQYEDQQIEMFGCLIKDIKGGAILVNTDNPRELNNYAICILSDAQSVLDNGDAEKARQFMNKAKYLLSEASDILRKQEAEVNDQYLNGLSNPSDTNSLQLATQSNIASRSIGPDQDQSSTEPSCVRTEDGYVFFRLEDGSYADDRNELHRDLSYKSLGELSKYVAWNAISEDEEDAPGMK